MVKKAKKPKDHTKQRTRGHLLRFQGIGRTGVPSIIQENTPGPPLDTQLVGKGRKHGAVSTAITSTNPAWVFQVDVQS
jgi:hypothetical protein